MSRNDDQAARRPCHRRGSGRAWRWATHLAERGLPFAHRRRQSRGRPRLAFALGFAEALHRGPVQPPAGHGVPRCSRQLPGQGRRRRLPSGLRREFELPVRLDTTVTRLTRPTAAATSPRPPTGRFGPTRSSSPPDRSRSRSRRDRRRARPGAAQLHSADYRDPELCPAGRTLVVGGANSGQQIALELSDSRQVDIAVGERLTTLPQRPLGRDIWWWLPLTEWPGSRSQSRLGQRLSQRDVVIGGGLRELSRHGVTVRPRVTGGRGDGPLRRRLEQPSTTSSSGRPAFGSTTPGSTIPEVKDERGRSACPRRDRSPGLYLLGMTWQYKRTSALLGWVGDDAAYLGRTDRGGSARIDGSDQAPRRLLDQERREMHTHTRHFSTETEGLDEAKSPETVGCATASRTRSRSSRSASGSATPRCGCWPTTARSPGRRSRRPGQRGRRSRRPTTATSTPRVHWHGLRLENRYDGVPDETQAPIPTAAPSPTELQFPDAGFYWYHPHMREDFAQEMGLYGTIIVEPADRDYWPPVDRELTITLDDLLIEDGQMAPVRALGADLHGDGPVRQRDADQRRDRVPRRGQGRRGRAPPSGQHGQHPDLQLRLQRRADEAGRRRQRPRTSGRSSSTKSCSRPPSGPSSTSSSRSPARSRLEHRTPDHTYDLGAFTVTGEAAGEAARRVRGAADRPRARGRARAHRRRPRARARQGAGLRLGDADPLRRRRRARPPPTSARCTRRSPTRSDDRARSAG